MLELLLQQYLLAIVLTKPYLLFMSNRRAAVICNIDASTKGTRVDGFDYSNGCHVDGSLPSLVPLWRG